MPSGFRLNFTPNRPSPSPRSTVASQQTERSNSSSSTEFEKVSLSTITSSSVKNEPKPLKSLSLATDSVMPNFDKPADSFEAEIPRTRLTEEEKEFAEEERQQWCGELQRMKTFTTFLDSIKSTFSSNNDERCQKFRDLLDGQEAEYLSRDGRCQGSFDKDIIGFSTIAKENQSKWEANASFYELTRETLMVAGRGRRTIAKEAAVKRLVEGANEIRRGEQESFDEEVQRMDTVVSDLVEQAKQATERLMLETTKARDNSLAGEGNEQLTLDNAATASMLPNAELQPYSPGSILIPARPRSISPFSRRSRSRTRSPTRIILPPCVPSRPRSRSPQRCAFEYDKPQKEPTQISTPAPCPASSDFQRNAVNQVILDLVNRCLLEWQRDEQGRNGGEGKRQELFDSALSMMRTDHSSSMESLRRQSISCEARRGNAETKREQEFDALLLTIRGGFDLFKAGVEKKLAVLNMLEDEYDEQLKAAIRATSEREEKEFVRGRKRLSTKFEQLQNERRDRLMKASNELRKAKHDLKNMNSGEEFELTPSEYDSIPGSPHEMPVPCIVSPPTNGYPMAGAPPVIIQRSRSSSRSSRSRSPRRCYSPPMRRMRSRSRSPAVGFTPQTLFKMRNVSTLPTPQPLQGAPTSAYDSCNTLPSVQSSERAKAIAESLSKQRFIFAINETKRQVAFEQARIERQNVFNSAELERASAFQNKLQEQIWRFWEAEDRRELMFIGKSRLRSERFAEEQKKMGREYNETEERLVRDCSRKERQRVDGLELWMDRFVEQRQDRWEEEIRRETLGRNKRFREMAMDAMNAMGGFSFTI